MRVGLPVSLFSHGALVVAGLVSLASAPPVEPRQIEAINVDIIPLTQFSNIRAGALDSKILDTRTPSIVNTPVPAKLAQPTGNTQENQAMPLATNKVTPAPTEQTAPEPAPAPAPAPKTAPKPPAIKTPVPKPTPVSDPAPASTKTAPKPTPVKNVIVSKAQTPAKPVAPPPIPVMRTASLDRKRADYAARKRAEVARKATRISDIINAEKSRGATTGTGGKTTLGTSTGQAATLTRSEQDALVAQMRQCWQLLPGEIQSGLSVRLLVDLNKDGTVVGTPQVTSAIISPMLGSIARAAQRAVLNCGPYRLAPAKYAQWKQIDVTFKASDQG